MRRNSSPWDRCVSAQRKSSFRSPISSATFFTEVYGYSASRRAIWYGFFASFILVTLTYITVIIPPAPEYTDQRAFETIFKPVGRIVVASLLAYWCGEFANSLTLAKLKLLTGGKYLWTRTIGSTVVGQAVDTTVVMFAAFYGLRSLDTILRLIVAGYLVKVVYETLMTPVTYAIVNFLKRAEGVDYFDRGTNFNPFATAALGSSPNQPAAEEASTAH